MSIEVFVCVGWATKPQAFRRINGNTN